MSLNVWLTSLFIVGGMAVMLFAVFNTRRLLALLAGGQYRRGWRALFLLMCFFAVGYGVALVLVLAGYTSLMLALTGVIFFFGALFVYLVVTIGYRTIGDLVSTQAGLEATRDQALAASRFKSELLARVSHELRTPLHAILGYTDMLGSEVPGPLGDRQRQINDRISANTHQLIEQINSLLKRAEIESGQIQLRPAAFPAAELLHHLEMVVGPLASQKELELRCEMGPTMPVTVVGDRQRLQEIATNLAGNAVKFTETGGVHVCLDRPEAEAWTITVTDTGPGIPAAAQLSVFEAFRQVDGSATRVFGGAGLGLAIARDLTELMGGRISLTSHEGQGSTFTVWLPWLAPADTTDEAVADAAGEAT